MNLGTLLVCALYQSCPVTVLWFSLGIGLLGCCLHIHMENGSDCIAAFSACGVNVFLIQT